VHSLSFFSKLCLRWIDTGIIFYQLGQPRSPSCDTVDDRGRTDQPPQSYFQLQSLFYPPFLISLFISCPQSMDQRQFDSSGNYDARLGQQGQQGRHIDSVSEGSEQYEQHERSAQPPTVTYEQNQSDAFWYHQVSFQERLPYGRSPNSLSSPSTSSVEQSALGELSQGSAFTPQNLTPDISVKLKHPRFPTQDPFNPQILQENSFAGAYIWPRNDGNDFSHSYDGPTVTPHLPVAAPSTSKRKREPDSPPQVLLSYPRHGSHLVPQSSAAPYYRDKTVLCSRCNIYESLVSQLK
jgi:hypothetical protein